MPRLLGWLLMIGGVGYILSTFLTYMAPSAGGVADALTIAASIGEFWMIGYLLVIGIRRAPAGG